MDARSIAATAANKGVLTPATEFDGEFGKYKYHFDANIYKNRVFDSKGVADPSVEIHFGPNIKDWPKMVALTDNLVRLLLTVPIRSDLQNLHFPVRIRLMSVVQRKSRRQKRQEKH